MRMRVVFYKYWSYLAFFLRRARESIWLSHRQSYTNCLRLVLENYHLLMPQPATYVHICRTADYSMYVHVCMFFRV